jgi:O-antigen/teichoic acid export membrane protein
MSRSIYKNTIYKGALSFCNAAIPLIIIPHVYRVLNPSIIGSIEYGNTLYIYFYILGSLGIYNYGIREISKVREEADVVRNKFHNLFWIGLISNVFSFVLFILFAFVGSNTDAFKTIIILLSTQLLSNIFYTEWITEAYEEFAFITIKTLTIRLLSVAAIFLLVKNENDYLIYIGITVLVTFLNNIASFVYAFKYTKVSMNFRGIEWKKYIPPLIYILILNNSAILYTMLDRTMLGIYGSAEGVAYYAVGQKVMEMVRTLLLTAVFVTLPRLSYYLHNDYKRYVSGLHNLTRLVMFITIPSCIALILLSREIVLIFAGPKYMSAILPTQVFAFRVLVLAISSIISQQVLFLHEKEKFIIWSNLIFGVLNLLAKVVLIGMLSPFYAILSTTIVEILLVICQLVYAKRYLNINIEFFSNSNYIYLACSIIFIPLIFFIRSININGIFVLVTFSVTGSILFLGAMILVKDSIAGQLLSALKKGIYQNVN